MTDEKKREDDEVADEQLENIAGGATADTAEQDISVAKDMDKASPRLAEFLNEGSVIPVVEVDLLATTEDEDD